MNAENLSISLHRGISIAAVVLPLIISCFSMHITGEYLSNCLTFLPLEMWHELFCHNFENYSQLLWMRKLLLLTSSTWFRHAESSNLLLRSTFYSFYFENSIESFIQYGSTFFSFHFTNSTEFFITSTLASHARISFLSWGSHVA